MDFDRFRYSIKYWKLLFKSCLTKDWSASNRQGFWRFEPNGWLDITDFFVLMWYGTMSDGKNLMMIRTCGLLNPCFSLLGCLAKVFLPLQRVWFESFIWKTSRQVLDTSVFILWEAEETEEDLQRLELKRCSAWKRRQSPYPLAFQHGSWGSFLGPNVKEETPSFKPIEVFCCLQIHVSSDFFQCWDRPVKPGGVW